MEERIRICLISFMFAPLVGGAEVRAEKQARQLKAMDQDVMIVTLRHNKEWKRAEMLEDLPIVRVGGIFNRQGWLRIGRLGHLPIDVLLFITLWRMRHQYDVLHALQLSSLAAVAVIIGKLTHKPVIIGIPSTGPGKKQQKSDATLMADTLTDTEFLKVDFTDVVVGDIGYLYKSAFGGRAIVRFLKKSNAYYQILSSRSRPYLASLGFRSQQIVLIPNGVDSEKFRPAPERRPDPAQPERDMICVARLQYPKGIDVLLHAWARMLREPDEWRAHLRPQLLLVGEGPLRPQLERIAEQLGIQDSVKFLGLRRDTIDLLQQSWGFVMPSRWEGMPNALLEGMACGLPCIATKVSGSEDIIVDGVNGLLIEPERPQALAQAIRRIIEDGELAQRLAEEGRAIVMRDYQLSGVVKRCLELYRLVLKSYATRLPLVLEKRSEV
ncbi:MAG TPA: glycosyltransferase family 4 protein [Ktedonobacteraceae bacterium]|nr:glycosyltransferase family 4 protein [Ktedonobacteraceae bacterium]